MAGAERTIKVDLVGVQGSFVCGGCSAKRRGHEICELAQLEKELHRIPSERDVKYKVDVSKISNWCPNGYISPDNRPLIK